MRYSATLIDHFRYPRNAGMMREPDGVGEGEYGECMDVVRFYLRVCDGRVTDARFQTYGCGPTIAASSAGTELVIGALVRELVGFSEKRVEAAVGGLPEDRVHAAQVVASAIRAAAGDALRRLMSEGDGGFPDA